MNERVDLRITQKIQVSRDGKTWFNSNIQDIRPGVISISIPYLKEQPLVLYRGEQVQVRFYKDDCSYYFETPVTGEVIDNINLFRLAYPKIINRVQKRMHVRLPVMLDVEYAPAVSRDGTPKKIPVFTKASTVDISGGGIKIAVRKPMGENKLLRLKFTLPLRNKMENLELEAQVIRCIKVVDTTREVYHLGLKFQNINHRQQDSIVRFIFEKMARQKRML